MLNGDVVSVPIGVPLAKNCTLETVFDPPAVVVALTFVATPTAAVKGALNVTVGAGTVVTVNVCGVDVRVVLFESVTRAVTECAPNGVAGQVAEKGEVASEPTTLPSTRNSTSVTVAPDPGVAVAVNDTLPPITAVAGAVSEMVGATVVAVTVIAGERTTLFELSIV
jgi:hypothetical protein